MGEIAEDIISGFYCNQCGEMIDGESPGFPRNCGCSSNYWNFNDDKLKKKKRKERARNKIKNELYSSQIKGIEISEIAPWHIRVTSGKLPRKLDIFPTSKKYHYITKDERGKFKNVVDLVKKIMEIE